MIVYALLKKQSIRKVDSFWHDKRNASEKISKQRRNWKKHWRKSRKGGNINLGKTSCLSASSV